MSGEHVDSTDSDKVEIGNLETWTRTIKEQPIRVNKKKEKKSQNKTTYFYCWWCWELEDGARTVRVLSESMRTEFPEGVDIFTFLGVDCRCLIR